MNQLVKEAIEIWQAGVDSVRGDRLVAREVSIDDRRLIIQDEVYDLSDTRRILVVGGGKATAAMADGLLQSLGPKGIARYQVSGWINVPEGTFTENVARPIRYFAARPAGRNEPTEEAVYGTRQILELVSQCDPRDLVLCLISGGGSALLCAPPEKISLLDKTLVTRLMSDRGATIEQLNSVRRSISTVKAGGLARACRANRLITLILSDVLGDPIDMIASGPTVVPNKPCSADALQVLSKFDPDFRDTPKSVIEYLKRASQNPDKSLLEMSNQRRGLPSLVKNIVIGNNATAVDHSGQRAVQLGYAYWMQSSHQSEGMVDRVADVVVNHLKLMQSERSYNCLILGGEPSVVLPASHLRGLGGRNQQLVLAVLLRLMDEPDLQLRSLRSMVFLSGGTDGEDGPTNATGAWIDEDSMNQLSQSNLDARLHFERCDAYRFFEKLNGLLITGPTNTNVCDLRIALFRP